MSLECVVTSVSVLFLGFVLGRVTKGMFAKKNRKKEISFPSLITSRVEQEYPHVQRIETRINIPPIFPSVPVQPLPVPKDPPNPIVITGQQSI